MRTKCDKNFTMAKWVTIFKRGRKFYHLSDLMKLSGLAYHATRKAAQRLVKNGILVKLYPEFFGNSFSTYQAEEVANTVYQPSYISCETALFHHGVIDQAPFTIVSVSTRKSKRIKIDGSTFVYCRVKHSLFWGYNNDAGYLLAEPEKALLDWLYLATRKKNKPPLDEINWDQIDLKKLKRYVSQFPKLVGSHLDN